MNKTSKTPILLVSLLIISGLMISACQTPRALAANAPNYIAIENTLNSYLEIDAAFRYTLDDNRLSEILANDPRGGPVSDSDVQLVRYMRNNPDLPASDIGLLDVKKEWYAYCRLTIQIYEQHLADGTLPNVQEEIDPGDLSSLEGYTPDPLHIAEVQSRAIPELQNMMLDSGRLPCVPLPADRIVVDSFVTQSITVDKDLAHVIGDFSYAKVDLTFARIDGNWHLIGRRIIQWHAG